MDLVRQHDYRRYLATLYLSPDIRGVAFAIYAFNVEISRIGSLVSEPMAGEIRLQWWRDIIENKGDASASPVAIALVHAIRKHSLPVKLFARLLEARVFDLYSDPMPDLNSFEGYLGETRSVLFQLILHAYISGGDRDLHNLLLADACGHAGVFLGIVENLEQMPVHMHQRKTYFPDEICNKPGLDTLPKFTSKKLNSQWLSSVCEYAAAHLSNATNNINQLPEEMRTVFLPIAGANAQLKYIADKGIDLSVAFSGISQIRTWWSIRKVAKRGKF